LSLSLNIPKIYHARIVKVKLKFFQMAFALKMFICTFEGNEQLHFVLFFLHEKEVKETESLIKAFRGKHFLN
ncbi:hypothetical protein T03_8970, partial [Trichinella britovi]